MSSILCLPNEVLLNVVANVHHDGIESFSLSCKSIYAFSKDILLKHRMRKRYANISLLPLIPDVVDDHGGLFGHLFCFVQQLLDDDGLRPYITSLSIDTSYGNEDRSIERGLEADDEIGSDWQDENEEMSMYYEQINAILGNILGLSNDGFLERTMSRIIRGHQGAKIGLLLCMLPNLVELSLYGVPCRDSWLAQMMQRALGDNVDGTMSSSILSKLSVLDIGLPEPADGNVDNFDIFESLRYRPSLRTLRATRLRVKDKGRIFNQIEKAVPSSLESIELTSCYLGWNHNSDLFSLLKCLKKVRLAGSHGKSVFDYHPGSFRDVVKWLKSHSLHTLESLEVIDLGPMKIFEDDVSQHAIGSLHEFTSLRILEVPIGMLIAYVQKPGVSKSRKKIDHSSSERIPLATILPPSLEHLTLAPSVPISDTDYNWFDEYQDLIENLFRGVAEKKAGGLPGLQSIQFQYRNPLTTKTMRDLRYLGIRVRGDPKGKTMRELHKAWEKCPHTL